MAKAIIEFVLLLLELSCPLIPICPLSPFLDRSIYIISELREDPDVHNMKKTMLYIQLCFSTIRSASTKLALMTSHLDVLIPSSLFFTLNPLNYRASNSFKLYESTPIARMSSYPLMNADGDQGKTSSIEDDQKEDAENLDEDELFLKREMLLKELGCLNNYGVLFSKENDELEAAVTVSSTVDHSFVSSQEAVCCKSFAKNDDFHNIQHNESFFLKTPEIDDIERNNFGASENDISGVDPMTLRKFNDTLLDEKVNFVADDVEQASKEKEMDDDEDENDEDLDVEAYDLLEKDCEEKKKLEENKKFDACDVMPKVWKKIVLKRRAVENFEILPENWIEITHSSGMPVYLHKLTRVCTVSRPYFLGMANVRRHHVPLAAIPCLNQTRLKEEETARKKEIIENGLKHSDENPLSKLKTPCVKVEGANDKNRYLNPSEFRDYCKKKFDFETVNIVRFRSWTDHRKFHKKKKQESMIQCCSGTTFSAGTGTDTITMLYNSAVCQLDLSIPGASPNKDGLKRPMLPPDTKIITVPDFNRGRPGRQFLLNPRGKTIIALLHEYVQKVLKGQVAYEFSETRNAANPYMAKAKILPSENAKSSMSKRAKKSIQAATNQPESSNGPDAFDTVVEEWVAVGVGNGNSKRNAKSAAARDALRILLPGLDLSVCTDAKQIDQASSSNNQNDDRNSISHQNGVGGSYNSTTAEKDDADIFDTVTITDPRVHEMSIKAGQPAPFVILQECLKRNAAFGDTTIEMNVQRINHHRHEFTMKVGKGRHEVKVRCLNKKDGKQKASQFMLQKLQPQAKNWGTLVRLYGYSAQQKLRENRRQKDDVIKLHAQHLFDANNHHSNNIISNNGDLNANNQSSTSNYRDLEPNMAILSKLRKEMKKLYKNEKAAHQDKNTEKLIKCPKMIDI
uniref:DRBM domain-containing protein n=1 Tax=Romanomermis culicivorax TaxID=13658 RepID=A0A915JF78_ROMCU